VQVFLLAEDVRKPGERGRRPADDGYIYHVLNSCLSDVDEPKTEAELLTVQRYVQRGQRFDDERWIGMPRGGAPRGDHVRLNGEIHG